MQSHQDSDFKRQPLAAEFMANLEGRANRIHGSGGSQIAGGKPGETILAQWTAHGIAVKNLPPDEQGILRVSIGGGEGLPVVVNYCVFRGNREACIALLKKALAALEQPH